MAKAKLSEPHQVAPPKTHHEAVADALNVLVRWYGEDQVAFAAEGWLARRQRRRTNSQQYPKHTHGRLPNQPESDLKTYFVEAESKKTQEPK